MGNEIVLGVAMFTGVIMLLVFVILYARRQLVSTGEVTIEINGDPDKTLRAPAGTSSKYACGCRYIPLQLVVGEALVHSVAVAF